MISTSTSCADRPRKLEPYYARRVDLQIGGPAAGGDADPHRVTVRLERLDPAHEGQIETVKARYVVGCDGARSAVRKSIGRTLHGDSANHAWGVMDVLAVTDFPDVRCKSLIQSANDGSMLIIPREGGYLFRLYIELTSSTPASGSSNRNITPDDLIAKARRILHPVHARRQGDRLVVGLRDRPAADATSSTTCRRARSRRAAARVHRRRRLPHPQPEGRAGHERLHAGRFNLGWKLASVLRKRCAPRLLHTYSAERQAIAKELIDFDREWAALLASEPHDEARRRPGRDPALFRPARALHCGDRDALSPVDDHRRSRPYQHLAKGFVVGMRFHSAPVIRVADAKPVHLGHVVKADGRWRIFAFAGRGSRSPAVAALCDFLAEAPQSPVGNTRRQERISTR